jgi:hypothetical protein
MPHLFLNKLEYDKIYTVVIKNLEAGDFNAAVQAVRAFQEQEGNKYSANSQSLEDLLADGYHSRMRELDSLMKSSAAKEIKLAAVRAFSTLFPDDAELTIWLNKLELPLRSCHL